MICCCCCGGGGAAVIPVCSPPPWTNCSIMIAHVECLTFGLPSIFPPSAFSSFDFLLFPFSVFCPFCLFCSPLFFLIYCPFLFPPQFPP
ncbi:hypothetical protein BO78DRAFT_54722 [Aspergillus sclerotiicarbonarius CBS 121057]|uniref:Uncharacterized protein n=1 Tax=Aspergillus sclerotiicarbonarius (strain CBS 121057 / IBT 28362) TaxID=1448318 RepID=A0A319EMT5_ASPSB|nr:hypothetical protein BO78DRAFT_54722 [Aspergillus sclerotiicarbonarius CBS 121057]